MISLNAGYFEKIGEELASPLKSLASFILSPFKEKLPKRIAQNIDEPDVANLFYIPQISVNYPEKKKRHKKEEQVEQPGLWRRVSNFTTHS